MGPFKFVIFYLLGGLAATALHVVTDSNSEIPTLGASGAIAAVLGGYMLLFPRARVVTVIFIVFFFTILELPALLVLGVWFLQQALFAYFDLTGAEGGVAYFAHIGGFVFGLLAIKLFASRKRVERQTVAVRALADATAPEQLLVLAIAARGGDRRARAREARADAGPGGGAARRRCRTRRRRRWPAAGRRRRRWRSASTTRATRSRSVQAPAPLGAAVRPRHRPGAVAARPDAGAPDRQPDQDDDRAGRRRADSEGLEGAHHQRGAALPRARASGCSRAASGSASTRCCTACCCRRATTPRSRSPSAPRAAASSGSCAT